MPHTAFKNLESIGPAKRLEVFRRQCANLGGSRPEIECLLHEYWRSDLIPRSSILDKFPVVSLFWNDGQTCIIS